MNTQFRLSIKMLKTAAMLAMTMVMAGEAQAAIAVIDSNANVRTGARQNARSLGIVKSGTRIRIISQSGSWYGVRVAGGGVGYIHKSLVKTEATRRQAQRTEEREAPRNQYRTEREPSRASVGRAGSEPKLFAMYGYKTASAGLCMPPVSGSPEAVLRRNGIRLNGNPSSGEIRALAKGIGHIERLLGKTLPRSWQTPYNFISTSTGTSWNQGRNAINVRRVRSSGGGENVARLMHELGHKVGNAGAYEAFARYPGAKSCNITTYCSHKRAGVPHRKSNERFAEVFSAYVTYPDLLKAKCPAAYRFFEEKLFPGSRSQVATCSGGRRDSEDADGPRVRTEGRETRRNGSVR